MPGTIFCNRCGTPSGEDARFCQHCGASFALATSPPPRPLPHLAAAKYAGFWIRVVAAIVDWILLFGAIFPVRFVLGSIVTMVGINAQIPIHQVWQARRWTRIAIGIVLAWIYRAGMESSGYQATLGKLAARLKVTDLTGARLSFGRATARYFAKYLSLLALGLGYLMVAFDEQKQGLHDRIAGTLVMRREWTP